MSNQKKEIKDGIFSFLYIPQFWLSLSVILTSLFYRFFLFQQLFSGESILIIIVFYLLLVFTAEAFYILIYFHLAQIFLSHNPKKLSEEKRIYIGDFNIATAIIATTLVAEQLYKFYNLGLPTLLITTFFIFLISYPLVKETRKYNPLSFPA